MKPSEIDPCWGMSLVPLHSARTTISCRCLHSGLTHHVALHISPHVSLYIPGTLGHRDAISVYTESSRGHLSCTRNTPAGEGAP